MALPVIVRQPRSTAVEIYGVATFECIARSYGNTSIIWRKQNSELPETAIMTSTMSLNETKSTLRIEKSIGYYRGYYYCVIENSVGIVNSTVAYCNITGKYFIITLYIIVMYSACLFYSTLSTNDCIPKAYHCTS